MTPIWYLQALLWASATRLTPWPLSTSTSVTLNIIYCYSLFSQNLAYSQKIIAYVTNATLNIEKKIFDISKLCFRTQLILKQIPRVFGQKRKHLVHCGYPGLLDHGVWISWTASPPIFFLIFTTSSLFSKNLTYSLIFLLILKKSYLFSHIPPNSHKILLKSCLFSLNLTFSYKILLILTKS